MSDQSILDAEGNVFHSNNVQLPQQRWSTFFTFTSPCVLERAGVLEYQPDDDHRWLIKDNTVDCNRSRSFGAAQSGLVVDEDQMRMLFQHESVVSAIQASTFYAQTKKFASALPYVVVTVEPIYESLEESFGRCISVQAGLDKLEQWNATTVRGDAAAPLVGFVDGERDGEWFGVDSDYASWMDECQDDAPDDNSDFPQPPDDYSSVDNSMRIDDRPLDRQSVVDDDAGAGAGAGAASAAPSPRVSIGTRISVQLNDSAVGSIFSLQHLQNNVAVGDENANVLDALDERRRCQKAFFEALDALDEFMTKFPLRCTPSDVSLCKPIPRLGRRHGLQLSLYDYQRRAVHWLLSIEQREASGQLGYRIPMHNTVQYRHLPLRFADKKIVFDQKSIEMDTAVLHVRGGIVAAKTGTGKTTMTIAAIHLQRCFEHDMARKSRRRGDAPDLPTDRLPPAWSKVKRTTRFYANCTLVIAPRQMTQQWLDEFAKTLDANSERALRIDAVRSVKDVRRLSIAHVQRDLDVLVVNKEIFKSPAYRKPAIHLQTPGIHAGERRWAESETSKWNYWNDDAHLDALVHASNVATTANAWPVGGVFTSLCLHAIWWRRIIIDEVHELDRSWSMVERAVCSLRSDHTHGLTATPDFDSHEAFGHVRDQENRYETVQRGYPALLNVEAGRALLGSSRARALRYYFTRLHSVTSSETVGMPTVHMHRVDVGLTPTEFAIYSSIRVQDLKRRLLFCSHHVLDDEQWQQLLRAKDSTDKDGESSPLPSLGGKESRLSIDAVAAAMQKSRSGKIKKLRSQLLDLQQKKKGVQREALSGFEESTICQRLVDIYGIDDLDALVAHMARFASTGTIYVCRIGDEDRQHAKTLQSKQQTHEQQAALRTAVLGDHVGLSAQDKARLHIQISSKQAEIAALTEQIRPLARNLADLEREVNFFDAVFNRLSNPDATVTCPICMEDERTKETVVLTFCGHEFCAECARNWFARSRHCPACRASLNVRRDLRTVDRTVVPTAPSNQSSSSSSRLAGDAKHAIDPARHGSKVAALLQLIATIRARSDFKKLVIYAQFERLLQLVVNALQECGEEVLMVRGSASQCQKAIERFRSDARCKIIVLSSENTISGIHLTEANHLIALHPILGTQEEAFAKHWQAVGRIRRLVQQNDCHVWSMVTRGTCEATMYDEQTTYAKQMLRRDEKIVWDR